jgi:type IV pilus assembly protein PilW
MRRSQQGLSLIELMISLVIGLILVLGVVRVFSASQHGYRIQESTGRLQENARFAMEILGRELRHADFFGGAVPDFIDRHASIAVPGAACSLSWMADISRPLFAYAGAASSPLTGCTSSGYVANTDILVVRYADPSRYRTTAYFTATDEDTAQEGGLLYLRARIGRGGYLFPFTKAVAEDATKRAPVDGDEASGVFSYQYAANVYFIRNNGTVPTLYQIRMDKSGASSAQQLVEGIEMMRLMFGVDLDGDAIIDRYLTISEMTAETWRRALVTRVGLLVRGDALDSFLDESTYTFPDGFSYTPPAAARRFQRRLFVQDLHLRNRTDRS